MAGAHGLWQQTDVSQLSRHHLMRGPEPPPDCLLITDGSHCDFALLSQRLEIIREKRFWLLVAGHRAMLLLQVKCDIKSYINNDSNKGTPAPGHIEKVS